MKKKKQNILVFGCSGLLGKCLIDFYQYNNKLNIHAVINKTKIHNKNIKTVFFKDKQAIKNYIDRNVIHTIINFAALTSIELCEKKFNLSKKINYLLPIYLAKISKEKNLNYVFISTDNFRFKEKKLKENSKIHSINNYGRHKQKSESQILKINSKSIIIRTNFYSIGNKKRQSFSDKILQSIKSKEHVNLFKDVYYTPIYGKYLLKYIFNLLEKKQKGIFNISSNEKITKFEFGQKICNIFKLDNKLIKISYLSKRKDLIKRPFNMALNNNKVKKILQIKIPSINYQIKMMKKDILYLKKKK